MQPLRFQTFAPQFSLRTCHELQNLEQKILHRAVTHARYIRKWAVDRAGLNGRGPRGNFYWRAPTK